MSKNKITKEYEHALQQFAARLPVPECKGEAPKLGSELIAEDPSIRDKDGNPLNPDQKYFVAATGTAVNHLKRLRKAYETGGQPAVVKYLQPYEDFLKEE